MVLDNVNMDLIPEEINESDWYRLTEIKPVKTTYGESNIAVLSKKNLKYDFWLNDSDARLLKRFLLSEEVDDLFRVCMRLKVAEYTNKKGEKARRPAIAELKAEVLK